MFDQVKTSTSPASTAGHRRTRGIARRVIVLGALATALVAGNAGTAQAFSYAGGTGSPGRVALPRILANDTQIYSTVQGYANGQFYTTMQAIASLTIESAANPVVYRSPRTAGAQDVIAVYVLERWNGSAWATYSSTRVTGRIPAGYGAVRLPKVGFTPGGLKGYFRVHFVFAWKVAGQTTNLGGSIFMADRASDFGCSSPLRPCEVGPGYLHVGRLYQAGGGW